MFFGSRCVYVFSGGSFPVSGMSVERGADVKGFSTRITSKRPFGSLLVVRFQVTSKVFLFPKLFLATGAFIRFLPSMDSLVSN